MTDICSRRDTGQREQLLTVYSNFQFTLRVKRETSTALGVKYTLRMCIMTLHEQLHKETLAL